MPSRGGAVLWDLDGTLIDSEASLERIPGILNRQRSRASPFLVLRISSVSVELVVNAVWS